MKLQPAPVVSALLLALATGCGGGGGGSAPAYDLNGWWEVAVRETDSGAPFLVLYAAPVTQQGTVVDLAGARLALEGSRLVGVSPDAASPARTEFDLAILAYDHIEGTVVSYDPPADVGRGDFRLRRVPTPMGTLTMNGRVMGQPVNLVSANAYASIAVRTDPTRPQYQVVIFNVGPDTFTQINITFDELPPIAPDTYYVTIGATRFDGAVSHDEVFGATDEGTVTFTRIGGGRVAGSYSFDLNTGGTVSGTFDVDVYFSHSS